MNLEPLITIVDDDDAFRSSLALLVNSFGFRVATFSSANEFLAAYDPQVPGCVIIDVRMPEVNGLSLQQNLAMRSLQPAIIIMTAYAEVPVAVRAMHQGAVDFLQKTCPDTELLDAIRRALERDQTNRADHAKLVSVQERLALLSAPEREVLNLVLQGKANKNIAAKLGVSPRTVEDRRARIMHKLKVESVPELVSLAILAGIRVED
jgi:two-component system, LuxR family, response regulator FixJ